MTNFDYLKKEDEFKSFIDIAIVAEKLTLCRYNVMEYKCE